MRKVTVIQEVYEYKELSKEVQEKVKARWYDNEDYSCMEEDLGYKLEELLQENKIKGKANLFYSLFCSQGDGVCFEGSFEWKGYTVNIKHTGRYYHSNSVEINITSYADNNANEKRHAEFKVIYDKICKEVEKASYTILDYRMSDVEFQENCETNDYNFSKDGKMVNL